MALRWRRGAPRAAGWSHLPLGAGWKLEAIDTTYGANRPIAWVDDDHGEAGRRWAVWRPGPTLLVPTDPRVGLTDAQVSELETWASAL